MSAGIRPAALPWAELDWHDNVPVSRDRGDLYFSSVDGLDEKRHVFVNANRLQQRWSSGGAFVVAELGFGSGLSFLAAADSWRRDRRPGLLSYVAFEQRPLRARDMGRALRPFSELGELRDRLVNEMPHPSAGIHRLWFDEEQIILTLAYGDFREHAAEMRFTADAWFIDVSPSSFEAETPIRNILHTIRRLSHGDTTFSTPVATAPFRSAAGRSGFHIDTCSGFTPKSEILRGCVNGPSPRPEYFIPSRVAVVGAGLAGCSAAYSLARRGVNVTLIDRESTLASGASGNEAGVIMPWMARVPDERTRFSLSGFAYTRSLARRLESRGHECHWQGKGMLRFAGSARLAALHESISATGFDRDFASSLSVSQASDCAGVEVSQPALFFPTGGSLSPRAFCHVLADPNSTNIEFVHRIEATAIRRGETGWTIENNGKPAFSPNAVVMAASNECLRFHATDWLPLEAVRGQVVHLEDHPVLSGLRTILCGDGYVAPTANGGFLVGSSFEHGNLSTDLDQQTQNAILSKLQRLVPNFTFDSSAPWPGRVSFRSSAPDRLPIVGKTPDFNAFADAHSGTRYGGISPSWSESWWTSGLYVSTGHASHGLTTAPLAGEIIADLICGTPPPATESLLKAINPLRFLVKKLNRS